MLIWCNSLEAFPKGAHCVCTTWMKNEAVQWSNPLSLKALDISYQPRWEFRSCAYIKTVNCSFVHPGFGNICGITAVLKHNMTVLLTVWRVFFGGSWEGCADLPWHSVSQEKAVAGVTTPGNCSIFRTSSFNVLLVLLFLFSGKPLVESWYNKHEADRNTTVWGESRGTKKVFSVYRQTRSHTPGLGSRQNVSLPDPLYSTVRFIFFSATYWSSIEWT